jgi:hypothetical protein
VTWLAAIALALSAGIESLRLVVSAKWLHRLLQRRLAPPGAPIDAVSGVVVDFLNGSAPLETYWAAADLPAAELSAATARHLGEVRRLLRRLWRVGQVAGMAGSLLAVASRERSFERAGLVSSIAGATGMLVTTLGFPAVWAGYHRIAYDNDDWRLPDTAVLAQLYPERFYWAAGALWLGLWSLLGLVAWKWPALRQVEESRSRW